MLNRRTFIAGSAAVSAVGTLLPLSAKANGFNPRPGAWRTFELTTKISLDAAGGGEPGVGAAAGRRR